MKVGIIGTGNIGGTIARKLKAAGHDVRIANSRVWKGSGLSRMKSARARLTPAGLSRASSSLSYQSRFQQ